MENLVLPKVHIDMIETLVDNGKNGFWNKTWYENRYGLKDDNNNWIVDPIFFDIYESDNIKIYNIGYKLFYVNKINKK